MDKYATLWERVELIEQQIRCYHKFSLVLGKHVCSKCKLDKPIED
jgi:hypothetical protein